MAATKPRIESRVEIDAVFCAVSIKIKFTLFLKFQTLMLTTDFYSDYVLMIRWNWIFSYMKYSVMYPFANDSQSSLGFETYDNRAKELSNEIGQNKNIWVRKWWRAYLNTSENSEDIWFVLK